MDKKFFLENLRCIPDFPKKGINFRDVTTLYQNAKCMKMMMLMRSLMNFVKFIP